ncbi:Protein of unknown function [Prosthecobacter debontii]|uniref:DUF3592 domain-containing protein n=2 Tax=Prosthecobacter debontii TaxID=48467 RepID=A0A1T4Y696_9BACT|nr:Protein of unknown function [Prosthecobacter debontii]
MRFGLVEANHMIRRLLALLVTLAICGTMVWFGWTGFSKSKASENWPTAPGVISSSRVVEHTKRSSGTTNKKFEAKIHYRYEVNGQSYQSDQVTFMDGRFNTRSSAESLANQFPTGLEVKVFYNPEAPAEAVLKRDISLLTLGLMIGGVLFFFIMLKVFVI